MRGPSKNPADYRGATTPLWVVVRRLAWGCLPLSLVLLFLAYIALYGETDERTTPVVARPTPCCSC